MCYGFRGKLNSAPQDHDNTSFAHITSGFFIHFYLPKAHCLSPQIAPFPHTWRLAPNVQKDTMLCGSQKLDRTRGKSCPAQLAACLHFTGVTVLEVLNNSQFICTQPSQLDFHYKRIKIEITSALQLAHMAVFPQEIGAPFEMQCGRNIWNLIL